MAENTYMFLHEPFVRTRQTPAPSNVDEPVQGPEKENQSTGASQFCWSEILMHPHAKQSKHFPTSHSTIYVHLIPLVHRTLFLFFAKKSFAHVSLLPS